MKKSLTSKIKPSSKYAEVTKNNIGTFKKLHQVIFPVGYSESFYKERLILVSSQHWFTVTCPSGLVFGGMLLSHALEQAKGLDINEVLLHALVSNEDAKCWCEKNWFCKIYN